jgi:hypothetical protein
MSSIQVGDAGLRALRDCRLVQLPKISDPRGNLTYVESRRHIPFQIRRVYWIYDIPGGDDRRSGHAYRTLEEFIIAISGSFDVVAADGRESHRFTLNRSYFGLYVPNTLWRRIENVSTNAVCLVLASAPYDMDDYIRDHAAFTRWRGSGQHE